MFQKSICPGFVSIYIFLAGCNTSNLELKVFSDQLQIGGIAYEIHMLGYDSTKSTGYFHPERIEIKQNKDAVPIQVIDNPNMYSLLDNQGELIGFVDDYNFDGHLDFGFSIAEALMGLEPYSLYLYNEQLQNFEYNDFLEISPHVELDSDKKELVMVSGRGDDYTTFTYKYKEGEFYVVKEIEEVYYYDIETRIITTTELLKGEMKQTDYQKFLVSEDGETEVKKSGQIKGQRELANFLRMIDGRSQYFDPVKIEDGEYKKWHGSCFNPGFAIVKFPQEEYELEAFNLEVYPILFEDSEAEENYSVRRITYRNYGDDFLAFFIFQMI